MVSFLVSPANDLMECSVPCRLIISLFIEDRDQLSTDKSQRFSQLRGIQKF